MLHYTVKEVYIYDGYSGLNFDRPAFKQLLCDIEAGKINMVITKDLSRKVKSTKRQRALNELFIAAQAPYGYIKDPTNKNHLIVDEDVRHAVELIF